MYDPSVFEPFYDYLKPLPKGVFLIPCVDRGLVDNAPESAKKAYEKWRKMELKNRAKGIQA